MWIPFALHRRIPLVRRPFWQRDLARDERDRARTERDRARGELHRTSATVEQLRVERDRMRMERDAALRERDALAGRVVKQPVLSRLLRPDRGPTIVNLPDAELGRVARDIYTLLRPREPVTCQLIRKGRSFDGGYVIADHCIEGAVVYSLGISDDVSWDLDMASLGCRVFQYDHTVQGPPVAHPNFRFFAKGIAARSSKEGTFASLDDLVARNGHESESGIVLKMDIEGAEWDVIPALSETTIARFAQIVVELHNFTDIDDVALRRKILGSLRRLNETHQVVHIHANNYGWLGMIGGVLLPGTFEVTYVRRAEHRFSDCVRCFPTPLDMPCNPDAPDYFLGALGCIEPAE